VPNDELYLLCTNYSHHVKDNGIIILDVCSEFSSLTGDTSQFTKQFYLLCPIPLSFSAVKSER
jgi:hypothetical protein